MKHKSWLVVVLCWAVLLTSSGVSFADDNEEVLVLQPDAEGIQRVFIILDSYEYAPARISVEAGVPIEFQLENQSFLTPHNFIIDYPAVGLQHNVSVDAGDSAMIRFLVETPGTYTCYCVNQFLFFPSHREEGMEGRLEVRPAGH
ncbi:MAG: quinol oxidase [Nitrospira sp. SB0672_bin_25]|nr:quinol oxidase [Nitrospira sp. SB0672_bin_25]